MGLSATAWMAIAAGTSAAVGVYSADQSRKASNQASDQAKANAATAAQQADEANNAASAKAPNLQGLMAQNQQAGGPSSTMLTGPKGVDPSTLTLGKTTLLGG